MMINGQAEQAVITVDRVSIDAGEQGCLTGCDVDTEVPHDFPNPILADWLIPCSFHSDPLYLSLV